MLGKDNFDDTGKCFRELIAQPEGVFGFGVANANDAARAEEAGAKVIYAGGYSINLNDMRPDLDLATMAEIRDRAYTIAEAVSTPVIVDIDTGYGGALNVLRTVKEFLGEEFIDYRTSPWTVRRIAGLHIEDQVFPKRCGHIAGKEVVPREVMVGKIKAACDMRNALYPSAVIIARTDRHHMKDPDSFWETIGRLCAYAEAGADLGWPELNTTNRVVALGIAEEVLKRLGKDYPLAFNYSPSLDWYKEPKPLTFEELATAGYKFIFVTVAAAHAASRAVYDYVGAFMELGARALWDMQTEKIDHPTRSHHEMARVPMWQALERKYSPDARERQEKSEGFKG